MPGTRRTRTRRRIRSSRRTCRAWSPSTTRTVDNGCLEVVSGMHHEVLPMDDVGCIRADVVESMDWATVEVAAGQTLWFHSPHAAPQRPQHLAARPSGALPDLQRRVRGRPASGLLPPEAAPTFAAEAAGDDRVRVSLIGDFQGRPAIDREPRSSADRGRLVGRRGGRAVHPLGVGPLRRGRQPARPRTADRRARHGRRRGRRPGRRGPVARRRPPARPGSHRRWGPGDHRSRARGRRRPLPGRAVPPDGDRTDRACTSGRSGTAVRSTRATW